MFEKILIANRGEIACRVIRTCKRLGVQTVAVFSTPDANSPHVAMADEAYHIGEAASTESYLVGERILEVAKKTGAQAVHPGYGFLSENAQFSSLCHDNGISFIGPPGSAIISMGSKSASKIIMTDAGVPCVPGYHGDNQDDAFLAKEANEMGFPIMIKAVLGGGGKGMKIAKTAEQFSAALDSARRESLAHFKDDRVLLERYVVNPRHVELQVFADTHGNCVHLFERDCSVQRRHQKVLEEAPAPGMTQELRDEMGSAACAAAKAVGYVGAGTVEFIMEPSGKFFFMEMNTRLQVEHPVTEMVSGQDLVEWQLKVAAGQELPLAQEDLVLNGHAIEARIYAENPRNGFLPGSGRVRHLSTPEHSAFDNSSTTRVDSGIVEGGEVSVHYDPMIAKLIVLGEDRPSALKQMAAALREYEVVGLPTNIDFVQQCIAHPAFAAGGVDTGFIEDNMEDLLPEQRPPAPSTVAMAALACVLNDTNVAVAKCNGSADPWAAPSLRHFRSLSEMGQSVSLEDDSGTARQVSVRHAAEGGSLGVHVDGGDVIEVTEATLTGELLEVTIGGHCSKARVVVDGRAVHLFFATPPERSDRPHQVHFSFDSPLPSYGVEGGGGGGGSGLTAPMPGKVIKLLVEPGSTVSIGEPVMVLEAMKMEHVLEAPCDGTVAEIFAAEGDFVGDSDQLVKFSGAEKDEE